MCDIEEEEEYRYCNLIASWLSFKIKSNKKLSSDYRLFVFCIKYN